MSKKVFFRIFTGNKEIGLLIVTVILFLVLSFNCDGFLTYFNLSNISRNLSIWVIIALAQALTIVVGGMNLSIGAIGALAATTVGYCTQWVFQWNNNNKNWIKCFYCYIGKSIYFYWSSNGIIKGAAFH